MIRGKLAARCLIFVLIVSVFAVPRMQIHADAEAAGTSGSKGVIFSTYSNSTLGMCFEYPPVWKKIEDSQGAWLKISNESSAHIRVEGLPNKTNQTLDQFTIARINLTKQQFPGREILNDNATLIGQKYPGHRIVFTHTEDPSEKKGLKFEESQAWTAYKDRIFVISYFTMAKLYDNYLPAFQKIIDSFKPC
jgi:hypothetical protein